MKKKGASENSSIRTFIRGVYKGIGHKCSEFVARLLGTSNESLSIVVYEKEMVREVRI